MVRFLRNIRAAIGLPPTVAETVVPAWMVRDIGLPPLAREIGFHVRERGATYRVTKKGATR